MAQAAQQVEAAVGVISGLQANMNGYTSQLGGGWQGNASAAFTRAYEMFSADFAKVLNSLQVIQEKLVSTRNTYQATEDTNTAQVNQVASLIGGGTAVKGAANTAVNTFGGGTQVKGGTTGMINLGGGTDGQGAATATNTINQAATAGQTGTQAGVFGGGLGDAGQAFGQLANNGAVA